MILILSGKYCRLVATATSLVLSFVSAARLQLTNSLSPSRVEYTDVCLKDHEAGDLVARSPSDYFYWFLFEWLDSSAFSKVPSLSTCHLRVHAMHTHIAGRFG